MCFPDPLSIPPCKLLDFLPLFKSSLVQYRLHMSKLLIFLDQALLLHLFIGRLLLHQLGGLALYNGLLLKEH